MKLEVGKSYRTRDGDKVTISHTDERPPYNYVATIGNLYREDGTRWPKFDSSGSTDLIAEWDETTNNVSEETVSNKTEFDWDAFNAELQRSSNICSGARKDIELAIKAGKGKPALELKTGQIWAKSPGYPHILAQTGNDLFDLIGLDIPSNRYYGQRTMMSLAALMVRDGFALQADSLKSYLANGGKI